MTLAFRDSQGRILTAAAEVGRGGEGTVFRIVEDSAIVVKVLHAQSAEATLLKVGAMSTLSQATELKDACSWPIDIVRDVHTGKRVGFTMPFMSGLYPLETVTIPKMRKRAFPMFSWAHLVNTARNLASAVAAIHRAGVVVGDINPRNVLVGNGTTVVFIDSDSFQVTAAGRVYHCNVGTPEYTPPELIGAQIGGIVRSPGHDCFGLAVLIFQLLMVGKHPFARLARSSISDVDIQKSIQSGYYAYDAHDRSSGLIPPKGAPPIDILPASLRRMMNQALLARSSTERPTAEIWVKELSHLRASLVSCSSNSLHNFRTVVSTGCPWCRLELSSGTELFYQVVHGKEVPSEHAIDALWAELDELYRHFLPPLSGQPPSRPVASIPLLPKPPAQLPPLPVQPDPPPPQLRPAPKPPTKPKGPEWLTVTRPRPDPPRPRALPSPPLFDFRVPLQFSFAVPRRPEPPAFSPPRVPPHEPQVVVVSLSAEEEQLLADCRAALGRDGVARSRNAIQLAVRLITPPLSRFAAKRLILPGLPLLESVATRFVPVLARLAGLATFVLVLLISCGIAMVMSLIPNEHYWTKLIIVTCLAILPAALSCRAVVGRIRRVLGALIIEKLSKTKEELISVGTDFARSLCMRQDLAERSAREMNRVAKEDYDLDMSEYIRESSLAREYHDSRIQGLLVHRSPDSLPPKIRLWILERSYYYDIFDKANAEYRAAVKLQSDEAAAQKAARRTAELLHDAVLATARLLDGGQSEAEIRSRCEEWAASSRRSGLVREAAYMDSWWPNQVESWLCYCRALQAAERERIDALRRHEDELAAYESEVRRAAEGRQGFQAFLDAAEAGRGRGSGEGPISSWLASNRIVVEAYVSSCNEYLHELASVRSYNDSQEAKYLQAIESAKLERERRVEHRNKESLKRRREHLREVREHIDVLVKMRDGFHAALETSRQSVREIEMEWMSNHMHLSDSTLNTVNEHVARGGNLLSLLTANRIGESLAELRALSARTRAMIPQARQERDQLRQRWLDADRERYLSSFRIDGCGVRGLGAGVFASLRSACFQTAADFESASELIDASIRGVGPIRAEALAEWRESKIRTWRVPPFPAKSVMINQVAETIVAEVIRNSEKLLRIRDGLCIGESRRTELGRLAQLAISDRDHASVTLKELDTAIRTARAVESQFSAS